MNRIFLCVATVLIAATASYGDAGVRKYSENAILAGTAVRISVGVENADIVGSDNRALQAAVDYVAGLGGGVVEIGAGEYLMRDSLHLHSHVTLRGAGEKTVLKKDASVYSLLAADGDFGEEAITVQNPEGFEVGRGVYVGSKQAKGFFGICATLLNRKEPARSQVQLGNERQDNYFRLSKPLNADCMMAAEAFAATVFPVISAYDAEDYRIESLAVDGNREHNQTTIDGCRGAGIFSYRGDGAVIENCIVRGYSGDGISFQQSNDVQVLNCLAEGNAGKGFHPGSGSQRPIIRGCKSIGNDDDGFFFCWRVRNAIVEDNEFRNNKGFGMSIGHKDSDNFVRKNTVVGNAKGGVYWRNEKDPMAAHRIEFVENTVEDNAEVGLFIDGETNGTVVRNNTIRDSGKGVQKVGVKIGANVGEVVLKDNTIRAAKEIVDERK
jgi:parallel beta-helix repeat protein